MKMKRLLLICLFIISIMTSIFIYTLSSHDSSLNELTFQENEIKTNEIGSKFFEIIPVSRSFDVGCDIYGDNLENLRYEPSLMQISKSLINKTSSEIYIEFEFDISTIDEFEMDTFIINTQVSGKIDIGGKSNITLKIYDYSMDNYSEIYLLSSDEELIVKENGFLEVELNELFTLSKIRLSLVFDNIIKIILIIKSDIVPTTPNDFDQVLSIHYCKMIIAKNINIKQLEPVNFIDHTGGAFHLTGDLNDTKEYDGNTINFGISNLMQYQTAICNFSIEYDLGYYANNEILGYLFQHIDWISSSVGNFYTQSPYIYIYNYTEEDNILIQFIKRNPSGSSHTIHPERWDSSISIQKGGLRNGNLLKVNYYVEVTSLDEDPFSFTMKIDLASLSIVRDIGPIIEVVNVIDDWVYCGESARINGTVHQGEYILDRVLITPIDDIITNYEGNFEYLVSQTGAGTLEFYIEAIDIFGFYSSSGPYYIQFNKRPIQIEIQLEEDPYPDPPIINISIEIKDALSQIGISNMYFDLIIEKDGVIASEYRNLITTSSGEFQKIQVINKEEYLDTEYTIIVEVYETLNYQFASSLSYITPIFAPCNVSISSFGPSGELWAGDNFNLTVDFHSLADVQQAWLILNSTAIQSLYIIEGINDLTLSNDRGGRCDYQVRVLNTRGYYNISNSVSINFKPNPINCIVEASIDNTNRYIFLNISIKETKLNRPLANIPINILIYDNNELFWDTTLQSTLPYTPIYIQFDLSSHNFTIQVNISETDLYEGKRLSVFNIPFVYKPYPFSASIPLLIFTLIGVSAMVLHYKKNTTHINKED